MTRSETFNPPALARHDPEEQGSAGSAIAHLLDVVRRRSLILVLVTLSVFAVITTMVFMATPKYVATTRIKIDPNQNAMIGVDTQRSPIPDPGQIDTEVTVMQSRDVALLVVKSLGLVNDAEFGVPAAPGISEDDRIDKTALNVLSSVSATRERSTYVIDINFTSANAVKAARIANSFATAYMTLSVGARSGTASRQAVFLEKRLSILGQELAGIEGQAAQYKARAGIIGGGANGSYSSTVVDQQLGSISGQLATALSSAAAAEAKLAVARQQMARGGIDAVSAVLGSPVVTDLRRQRAEVVRDMGDIEARYGPRHPEMIKITQQVKQIDDQINDEARRVMGSIASDAAAERAKANSLSGQVAALRGEQSSNTRAGVVAQNIQQQADAKRQEYNQLSQEMQQSRQLSRNTQTQAQIVEQALPPSFPSSPNKRLFMAFGLLLGLASSAVIVTALEILSRGLRSPEEVESRLKIPFITSIPRIEKSVLDRDGTTMSPADLLIERPATPYGEAFRVARNTLRLGAKSKETQIVALVSSLPNEGKTASVLSMARMMAMSGDKVLVLDGDIRKAGLSKLVKAQGRVGIVEVLTGSADLDSAIVPDVVSGLDILPVAETTFSLQDVFGSARMETLLSALGERYDVIILDTPPILGIADARVLASLADAVIMLIRWNSTAIAPLRSSLAALEMDRTPVSGAMFTMVDPKAEAIGALYYSKDYGKYYQASA